MRNLLIKEMRLAASPLTYFFLAAALMTMLPGYPILMGAFFICMGIFQSFQNAREVNDTLYTVLLPVKKSDFVSAKFVFVCLIQMIGFTACAILTAVRMTLLSSAVPYTENALMNATPYFLAWILLVFAAFNILFVGGFFRSGYKTGIPFLAFGIASLLIIGLAETIPHLPGLGFLRNPAGEKLGIQFVVLIAAAVIYTLATLLACRKAQARFEKIDL